MSDRSSPEEVFVDTCILLNFVLQDWETPHAVPLVESDTIGLVASDHVKTEFTNALDRREDMYYDMLDYFSADGNQIQNYDPDVHAPNDYKHILRIQQKLANAEDKRTALTRLREFVRAVDRRVQRIESEVEVVDVDLMAGFMLKLKIASVIGHNEDAEVVADAAAWTDRGGSGVLVTNDKEHMFDNETEIADVLADKDPAWVITILSPTDVLPETAAEPSTD